MIWSRDNGDDQSGTRTRDRRIVSPARTQSRQWQGKVVAWTLPKFHCDGCFLVFWFESHFFDNSLSYSNYLLPSLIKGRIEKFWPRSVKLQSTLNSSSTLSIGNFRVAPSCCFKARLSSKSLTRKWRYYSHGNKTHFHKKSFALSLVLTLRVFGTRKWSI